MKASEKKSDFNFKLPLLRNGTFHGEVEGYISMSSPKVGKESDMISSRSVEAVNGSELIQLEDLLAHMSAVPTSDGLGCGCFIS